MSRPKEVSFFQDSVDFEANLNYERGWDWYQQAFAHYRGEPVIGEATPSYSDRSRSPNTANRIYKFNPDMRIIYMVRDPLQRQISGWKMQYAFGVEQSTPWCRETQWALEGFDHWMRMQQSVGQWDECRYGYQLAAYRELFPANQICVSFLEDWKNSKEAEVERIMGFLGLDPTLWEKDVQEKANRGSDRRIARPVLKHILIQPFVRVVVKKLPPSWCDWARTHLAQAPLSVPQPDLSQATKAEFLEYVAADSHNFLASYGKKRGLWNELAVSAI